MLDKSLVADIVNITSKAAISCYKYIGKNNKEMADKAATDSMRSEINKPVSYTHLTLPTKRIV